MGASRPEARHENSGFCTLRRARCLWVFPGIPPTSLSFRVLHLSTAMGACMPTMGKPPAPPMASSVVLLGRPGAGCTSLLHALAVAAESSGKGGGGFGGGGGHDDSGTAGVAPRSGKGSGGKASAAVDGSGVTIRRLTVGGLQLDMMDVGALDQMHTTFRKNGLSATAVYVAGPLPIVDVAVCADYPSQQLTHQLLSLHSPFRGHNVPPRSH